MSSRSDWEPLPKPTLSPFARGYLSLCRFFTAAVWCVPALRVPLVHSLINHFRQKKHNHTETPGSEPRQAAVHPSDSFYAHYVHPRPDAIDSHVPPRSKALARPRGARVLSWRLVVHARGAMVGHVCLICWPICATMLGQTVTSQRFCRLLAPSAAQAVSNTFSRRCGTIRIP